MKKRKIVLSLNWSFENHQENVLGALDYASESKNWNLLRNLGDPLIRLRNLPHITFDGIVANIQDQNQLNILQQTDRPIVRVDNITDTKDVPGVFPDDQAIGKLAAQHFLSRNFTNFAVVTYPEEPFGQIRAKSYMESLAPHQCHLLEISDRWDADKFKETIETFLMQQNRATAIFTVNDDLATTIIYHALKLGIRIPEDLSVLGTGNNEFTCRKAMVGLSSIRLPERKCGYMAAQMLDNLLDGKKVATQTLPPIDIISRRSTDYFAVNDNLVAQTLRTIHAARNIPVTINDLTTELSVNRRTLERRFRKVMHKSPLEEVMQMRMSRAKRMLEHTQLTIIEISLAAGFPDLKSMETQFNKRENSTPEEYKKMLKA